MNFSDILFKIKKTISLKSKDYIKWLRKKGVSIGNGVNIYNAKSVSIDTQYPFLVSIGDNVNITEGVTILTHDYSWSTIKATSGELLGDCGKVSIGNNVFIGRKAIILKNVNIGENSIIGAGAVVTHDVPPNQVWGGVPAKFICTLDDYYKNRKNKQVEEAYLLFCEYIKKYNRMPSEEIFIEYISLFSDFSEIQTIKKYNNRLKLMNNKNKSLDFYLHKSDKKAFHSFDEMIDLFSKEYNNQ